MTLRGTKADVIVMDDIHEEEYVKLKGLLRLLMRSEKRLLIAAGESTKREQRTGTLIVYMELMSIDQIDLLVNTVNGCRSDNPIHAGMVPFLKKEYAVQCVNRRLIKIAAHDFVSSRRMRMGLDRVSNAFNESTKKTAAYLTKLRKLRK